MISPRNPTVAELFEIISEDRELLIINKPAGLVCHPTKAGEHSSLIGRARLHLGPGSHPQLVNRLDRETSGVTWRQSQVPARWMASLRPRPPAGAMSLIVS